MKRILYPLHFLPHTMKKTVLITLFLGLIQFTFAQTAGFNTNYHFLHSGNLVADKNFYLLTVINASPQIKKLIEEDVYLHQLLTDRVSLIKSHVSDTASAPLTLVGGFKYTADDSAHISERILSLYNSHKAAFDVI